MAFEQVKKHLMPLLEELDLSLHAIEVVKEYGFKILRITLDKKGGIDTDSLATVNRQLSELLDEEDVLEGTYMLEVSSPGAEKPIITVEDFEQAVGEYVHITLEHDAFEGECLAFNNDILTLRVNLKGRFTKKQFDLSDIKKARTAIRF